MPIKQIRKFGTWVGKQVDGFVGGIVRLADAPASSWLPAGLWSTLVWLVHAALYSLGTSTPTKQITASVALGIFALLTSWVTLGATLVLVGVFATTLLVGVVRLVPVVDAYFVRVRGALVP